LLYAVKTASRIADLVYILTTPENREMLKKLRLKTAEFLPNSLPSFKDIDCVLVGPGLGISARSKNLTKKVLSAKIKAVLDADALNVMDEKMKELLNPNHILTPHHREFKKLFGFKATAVSAQKMAKKYKCTIVLKGPVDYIVSFDGSLRQNKTGNQGMTKGGTGDVLAGLIAGLFCTNNAFESAAAGTFICGKAGDDLYKKVGTFYNAEDLCEQVPITFSRIVNSHKS